MVTVGRRMTGRGTRHSSGYVAVSAGQRGVCVHPDARVRSVCHGADREGANCLGIAADAADAFSENVTCALLSRMPHVWGKQWCSGALSLGICTRVQGMIIVSLTATCVTTVSDLLVTEQSIKK